MKLMRPLIWVARMAGAVVATVGGVYLAAWLGGYVGQRGAATMTIEANAALLLVLLGLGLLFLVGPRQWRWGCGAARLCGGVALIIALLTLSEHIVGWDLGIDQLLAKETPGAVGAAAPNRMDVPGTISAIFAGAAVITLSLKGRWVIVGQGLALAICLVALLSTIGFLYGVQPLYTVTNFTAIDLSLAMVLLVLALGLLCARPNRGLVAQALADDAGGRTIRWLLPACLGLPLLIGYLRLVGERRNLFDPAMGTALVILLFIVVFSVLVYISSHGLSRREAQQREGQEALRIRENELHLIMDAAPALISYVGADYRYRRVNRNYQRWFGQTVEQIRGRHVREVLGEEAWQAARPYMERALRGEFVEYERQLPFPDGGLRWVHVTYTPERGMSGTVLGFVAHVVDMTEQKLAETHMRRSEEKLRLMFETSPVGMALCEMDGTLVQMNQAYLNTIGYTHEEAMKLTYWDLTPRDYDADEARQLRSMEQTGKYGPYEKEYIHKSGRRVPVLLNGMIVTTDGVRRIWSLVTDITDRKRMEEELRRSRDELEQRVAERTSELEQRAAQLARLSSELTLAEQGERQRLAQLLHDHLQQLLVGAKLRLERLWRRADDQQRQSVEQIRSLLDESLDASRALTAELSPPILHEAGLVAGLEWLARWMRDKHGLVVSLIAESHLRPEREDVEVLLFQSVRELLFNVVKHSGVMRARVELARQDADHIRVMVSDEGVGLVNGQAGQTVQSRFGLFSIRERLQLLGGSMHIETSPGCGTRITLIAPFRAAPGTAAGEATPIPEPARAAATGAAAGEHPRDERIHILLVDDHVVMRQGLSSLLESETDLAVIGEASDGQEAVEMARRLHPDVILMDASMPRMDGVQATRIIHAEQPEVRIVGLSMYDEADRAAALLQAGASDYLSKSGSPELLLSAIRKKNDPPG